MKWSICVLSVSPQRDTERTRITGILEHQIQGYSDIELIINTDESTVGEKRQHCIDIAQGEYINFIDDDDLIAHDYIKTIYPLLDGVDYIGFRLQMYKDGEKQKPTEHSLKHTEWYEDDKGYYRGISHLNPIKTSLARQGTFKGQYAEDFEWAKQVSAKTQHFINKPMYFYFYAPVYSLAKNPEEEL